MADTNLARTALNAVEYRPRGMARFGFWILVLLACGLGFAVNYYTGPQFDHGAVFLVPCVVAAWYLGLAAGLAIVAASAAAWSVATLLQGSPAEPWAVLVNALSRFSVFLVIAVLVASVRGLIQRLAELSRLDSLTGVANAAEFRARAEHDLDVAARTGSPVSVLFIDLDNFKEVNDRYGHGAGDEVLRIVAEALGGAARRSDLAARLGGDEFALLLLGTDAEAARRVAGKVRGSLQAAFERRGLPVTVSIGIATSRPDSPGFDELLGAADRAMYAAKRQGKDAIVAA